MKLGRSLEDLLVEIERQQNSKKDFVARTDKINFEIFPGDESLEMDLNGELFGINDLAHTQIGTHIGMHKSYYDKCKDDAPGLLATNIKTWFDKYPAPRLIRTLDGKDRAFLSDTYRPLENWDFAEATVPIIQANNLKILSCEITETRLYIKVVDPRIERDVPTGRKLGDGSHVFFDTCSPVAILSNSEVGFGRLSIDTGVYTSACTNLMMIAKGGMKRRHVGVRYDVTESIENIEALLSDETRKATDKAIWLQIADVMKAAFNPAIFTERCEQLAGLSSEKIEGDVIKTVELTTKKFGLSDLIGKSIQRHIIEGGDLTRYGLLNAVTRSAQDVKSYDEATLLEQVGGKIVELPKSEWKELLAA